MQNTKGAECIVKVNQHFTDTLLKNLTTDIKYTENVSRLV